MIARISLVISITFSSVKGGLMSKKMKGKIHLLDPAMPEDVPAPLCTVRLGLSVTKNPEEVTCGNCLKMLKRQKKWKS